MTIIDTSGSIGPRELALIAPEIELIPATNDVTVVECDVAIRRFLPFHIEIDCGRGKRRNRSPLESALLARHRTALAVYFTDGLARHQHSGRAYLFYGV